ncbi:pilus assembly protein PilW [Pseudomonas sp. HMWF032]|uniref:PilW family protein n=1 Tax=Pseudomonas sp. HMWF032 TaxID=2056866 RepID=UPI000D34323D|nr:PilW family protein [Pseudomonas sp. HMWF032]PTS85341.1 pilus assembly protein PilW [Pseudomonas sp. HMWF032]PTT84805.1 pilus assembly protein PilW [Pseudomonas sp. HMWF010]
MNTRQLGISMIELLVAMLISSFLILGVTQVYLDNRSNTIFQQNQAGNIENSRFTILILEQELAKAGYRRRADHTMEYAFPAENAGGRCGIMKAGQVTKFISATEFCIRYQPAFTGATECNGNLIANIPTKAYGFSADTGLGYARFALNNSGLTCNGTELTTNIDGLRFNFGVNNLEDERNITRFTTTPNADENIRAIQFSVLAASTTEVTKEPASTIYEYWFDAEPTNKKLYSLFSTSTSMRNQMP